MRTHRITSEVECTAYDFGFAVRRDDMEMVDFTEEKKKEYALAKNKYCFCKVEGSVLKGETILEEGMVLRANPNTNLLYPRTSVPGAKYLIKPGSSVIQSIVTGAWN